MELIKNTRNAISNICKVGLVLLVTNASSFATVAMEKKISGYSEEQAAIVNSLNAVPILYDLGYELGYRTFYGNRNFVRTAEKITGFNNLIPRLYLD